MSSLKSLFNTFFIATTAFVVVSCVPTATEKKATCGKDQAFDSVSRSCYSISEIRRVPVATTSSASMEEEKSLKIDLTYTDANKDKAIACSVSNVSNNVQAISPVVTNGGLSAQANTVYTAASNLAIAIPGGVDISAMLAALKKVKNSFHYETVTSQVGVFKANLASLLVMAGSYPANITVQTYYNITQTELAKLNTMIDQANNYCQCSAGVCSTVIAPKLHKNGPAGFTYTITDIDGVSALKTVSINIAAMSTSTTHLQPVAQSSYAGVFPESATSVASSYPVTLSGASDISDTAAAVMQYKFFGTKTGVTGNYVGKTSKGKVTGCMDLDGSNDLTCIYTPDDGNDNDPGVPAPNNAFAPIGTDLTFTAKSEGLYGNSITIQYFNIQNDNTVVDPYVTSTEKFGLTNSSDAFIRVVGNAIKIFINPGITSSTDIELMVNSHPQASRLVTVTGAMGTYPVPLTDTPAAVTLTGGVDGYDTIPYYANNLLTNSTNTASGMLRISAVNDNPLIPRVQTPIGAVTAISFLEEEAKVAASSVSLNFIDVDSTVGFTVAAKIEDLACPSTFTETFIDGYFLSLITSTNFTIGATGAITCVAGDCTAPLEITAGLDFSGNACLYYVVTDSSGAASKVQHRPIIVTNINDAPQISSTALPVVTLPLPADSTNEDLVPALDSYADIYVGPGGGVWEESQTLAVTLTSSLPSLVPNVSCTKYTVGLVSPIGAVDPATLPAGSNKYFDAVSMKCYVSTGSGLNDWKLFPSLTAFPYCGDPSLANYKFGFGAPTITGAASLHYLDTLNNVCYKTPASAPYTWSLDSSVSNYKIAYSPEADISGDTDITVSVKDNGGTTNSGVETASAMYTLTVVSVDDPPVFREKITLVETNEGGAVQSNAFKVDEDAGSTSDENSQRIQLTTIISDNDNVLPVEAIQVFYDLNENGVEDATEARCVANVAGCLAADSYLDTAGISDDVKARKFYFKLDPVDGVSGNANITLTVSDGVTPITTSFSIIVHPIAALHGGWTNISSVGLKTDKMGTPVSVPDIQCNYNQLSDTKKCIVGDVAVKCTTSLNVPSSPNGVVTPEAANVIFWDSSSNRCYRSTGATVFSWVDMNTSCPVTRTTAASSVHACSDLNCITSAVPAGTPSFVGQYMYNTNGTDNTPEDDKCYVSTGKSAGNWIEYVPAKVTLAWKPFIMVGSGAYSAVQIDGWNVYRREVNADYDFKGGHLKNAASNATFTITDPTVRTFTDTTAVAGRVYYYVVRPVDKINKFPTYTPETFSEVRVIAAPANYSFVHRWIVNQEVCNGMNITNTTSPNHIDQTQNFRCEYKGPGETTAPSGFYDYGRDLLVDLQESGCAYAAAPRCTANGCIGMGNPTTLGYSANANDMYYDRSTGACYVNNGGGVSWNLFEAFPLASIIPAIVDKTNTALNAPLTNVSKTRAKEICEARTKPSLSYSSAGVVTAFTPGGAAKIQLPTKKDYMAYASQKLNATDSEITDMEQGFSLNLQSRCNGSAASGLAVAYTDSHIPSTSFIFSLPGTFSSGIRSLYTGSIPSGSSLGTEACVSRFGIQDLYGNVAEWVDDGVTCDPDPYSTKVCTPVVGGSFTGTEFGAGVPYAFDNETGPFAEGGDGVVNGSVSALNADIGANDTSLTVVSSLGFPSSGTLLVESEIISYTSIVGNTFNGLGRGANSTAKVAHLAGVDVSVFNDDTWLTQWTFADKLFGAGYFNYPLGLPLTDNINQASFSAYMDWILTIGSSLTNKLHEDGIIVNGSAGAAKTFAVGGSYLSGNRAGRFSSELISNTVTNRADVGFRCIMPIRTAAGAGGDYPVDKFYNYPN